MGTVYELDQRDLRGDGRIVIYKRPDSRGGASKTWHCRIKHHLLSGYVRKSTKQTSYELAASFAYQLYDEVGARYVRGDVPQPRASKSPKCSAALKDYKQAFARRQSVRRKEESVRWAMSVIDGHIHRYLVEQLKDPKISELTEKHIKGFFEYCRSVNLSENSIRRLYVVLRGFLLWLEEQKLAPRSLAVRPPAKEKRKRVSFSLKELRLLARRSRIWVHDGIAKGHHRSRFYCQKFYLVMSNCGCRNGELLNLKWQDITRDPNREDGLVLDVMGKTQNRYALLQTHATQHIRDLYDFRREELQAAPSPSEFVFCHRDGKPIKSFKKSFQSLLKHAELLEDRNGVNRSLYSLRHSYAEMRILEGLSVYQLAAQMGTSVEMLEHHYGDMNALRYSAEITKASRPVTPASNEYPF